MTGCSCGVASGAELPIAKVPLVTRNISQPVELVKFGNLTFSCERAIGDVLIVAGFAIAGLTGCFALSHPDLIGEIPKDMIVMNWAYGARDSYMSRIEPFKKAGLEQFVCPSVWNFNLIFPNEENAIININGCCC